MGEESELWAKISRSRKNILPDPPVRVSKFQPPKWLVWFFGGCISGNWRIQGHNMDAINQPCSTDFFRAEMLMFLRFFVWNRLSESTKPQSDCFCQHNHFLMSCFFSMFPLFCRKFLPNKDSFKDTVYMKHIRNIFVVCSRCDPLPSWDDELQPHGPGQFFLAFETPKTTSVVWTVARRPINVRTSSSWPGLRVFIGSLDRRLTYVYTPENERLKSWKS